MGTRSLTRVLAESGKELVCIYGQFDGYPEGMGGRILDLLGKRVIVNGFDCGRNAPQCNGMGCLAAMLVAGLKIDPATSKPAIGNVYIYPIGSNDCGEEFVYTVYQGPKRMVTTDRGFKKEQWPIMFKVEGYGKPIYDGPLADFDPANPEKVRVA